MRVIKQLRDGLDWWNRGFQYRDTIGIDNPQPELIDVRRHDDRAGKTVLLVDNYRNLTGLSVTFGGVARSVSASMISAIEIE